MSCESNVLYMKCYISMPDMSISMVLSCRWIQYDQYWSQVSCLIIIFFRTRPTRMFRYVLQRLSSHTSTSELSEVGYWKLMEQSTNHVYSRSRAYPGQRPQEYLGLAHRTGR